MREPAPPSPSVPPRRSDGQAFTRAFVIAFAIVEAIVLAVVLVVPRHC